MSQAEFLADNPYATFGMTAAEAPAEARLTFIRKTYTHLAAAVYALVMFEMAIFYLVPLDRWMENVFLQQRWIWWAMFGGYMVISWLADRWARSDTSVGVQYAGLFSYVAAFGVLLCPLLWIANHFEVPLAGPSGTEMVLSPITVAAGITFAVFGVLTAVVFLTRHDFSYLGPILGIAGVVGFALIGLAAFGLLNFGVLLCLVFVLFACGSILYNTSNILHHYRTDQHVAASLALFASVALLFWYILQIVIALSGRD